MEVLMYLHTPRRVAASYLALHRLVKPVEADNDVWNYLIFRRGSWPPELGRPYTPVEDQIIQGHVPLEQTNHSLDGKLCIKSLARNCGTKEHRETRKALGLDVWMSDHKSILQYSADQLTDASANSLCDMVKVLSAEPLYVMFFDGQREHLVYGCNPKAQLSVSGQREDITRPFSQLYDTNTKTLAPEPSGIGERMFDSFLRLLVAGHD